MRNALLILFLMVCMPLHAEMTIETIQLHQRTANELIPVLQPMVENGGSITGTGYKLFVRSSPTNIAQLRQMISQIDVAPKQLLISVSLDRAVMQENARASAHVKVRGKTTLEIGKQSHAPGGVEIHGQNDSRIKYDARIFERTRAKHAPQVQTMRVTEGLWATIKTGQAIPVATRSRNHDGTVTETYTYTAVASGFQVLPRVNGDNVTLSIRPQSQSPQPGLSGAYNTTEIDTTVSGKLGQWIALGSVDTSQLHSGTGIGYRTQQHSDEHNQIYVKVEHIAQ